LIVFALERILFAAKGTTRMTDEQKTPLRAILRELGLSNAQIKQAAARGKIRLRGVPTADMARLVHTNDVSYVPDAPKLIPGRDLAVLFRDKDLAIVWKPSGWLSVKAAGRSADIDVVSYVAKLFEQSFVVHRLDEETSGVMMVALNESTQTKIKALLEKHDVERKYLALVEGRPGPTEWSMDTMLVRNRGGGLRGSGSGKDAKRARTHFVVLERFASNAALVQATLETGRTHQVRIHLAESGHPVLGDRLYGNKSSARRSPRVALHAAWLGFVHPRSAEKKTFDIPLADDLERLRRELAMKPSERSRRKS